MAGVSGLHLPKEDEEGEEAEIETLESVPYWPYEFDHDDMYASDSDPFSPQLSEFVSSDRSVHAQILVDGDDVDEREVRLQIGDVEGSDSDSVSDVNCHCEDQVNYVMDLFERNVDQSHVIGNDGLASNPFSETLSESNFGVVEGNHDMNADYVELGLGLGLGIGFDRHGEEDDDNGGFMIEECGGEFVVGGRASVSESGQSSGIHAMEPFEDGVGVVGIGSDSDEEEGGVLGIDVNSGDDDGLDWDPGDLGLPLCWDCFRLEDQRESNEDFEWEEVDEMVDEREVMSMVIDVDEDISVGTEIEFEEEAGESREEVLRNLEWQVLLAVNNLERNPDLEHGSESFLADHEDYIYPAEDEMLFGQFLENESYLKSSPPAAKSVIENLPSIFLTQDDVQNNNGLCAVCKDEISSVEQAKQLPCFHYYHGDCIIPWLSIRNTCPVCRFELPTDDPVYEQRRTQRAGSQPGRGFSGQMQF